VTVLLDKMPFFCNEDRFTEYFLNWYISGSLLLDKYEHVKKITNIITVNTSEKLNEDLKLNINWYFNLNENWRITVDVGGGFHLFNKTQRIVLKSSVRNTNLEYDYIFNIFVKEYPYYYRTKYHDNLFYVQTKLYDKLDEIYDICSE
jgi:hypothetical protein